MRRLAIAAIPLLLALPAQADMYQDGSNAAVSARTNLGIGAPYGVLWSSLGVIADGTTDNTAALNALPATGPITADCAAGSFIRLNGVWNLKSNLDIRWQPGCRMVSYSTATYAITQADLNAPLVNVTLDGISFQKDARRSQERLMRVWVDHFKLLRWTFGPAQDGAMVVRGSCQEIAYGNSTVSGSLAPGTPGIRHVGNVPKVIDACNQAADVWVHDNNIVSGDGPYQACQPLESAIWTNVSSDDILYEKNSGRGNVFVLIGNDQVAAFNAYSCNKIVYRNNTGTGTSRAILIASNGAPVTNVTVANQSFDMSAAAINDGAIHIRGYDDPARPGSFSNILIENVGIHGTGRQALYVRVPQAGTLSGLVIRGSTFETPRLASGGGAWFATALIAGGSDITLQGNMFYGAHAGGSTTVAVGFDDGAADAGTVTRFRFLNNLITQVPASNVGLYMKNVATATVAGNIIRRVPGAASTTGIKLTDAGAGPPVAPGTTDITLSNNTINDLALPLGTWTCNGGATNIAAFNLGDAGHTCP